MPALTSIRTSEGKLEIVNQLLLPHTTEFIEIKTIEDAFDAIKSMKVFIHNNFTTDDWEIDADLAPCLDSRCACDRLTSRARSSEPSQHRPQSAPNAPMARDD